MAITVASVPVLRQVAALTRWVGAGRKLTQTGQPTMADARHLVALLETGDEIDPVIGKRVFHTRSSADLTGLAVVVAWAKAVGLLRFVRGRLVPVKKNQALLDRSILLNKPGWKRSGGTTWAPGMTPSHLVRSGRSAPTRALPGK